MCHALNVSALLMALQAFSGIKSKQTQREKRQARAQGLSFLLSVRIFTTNLFGSLELLALFGSRSQAQQASQETASGSNQPTLDSFAAST
jgi:hypothetical protein